VKLLYRLLWYRLTVVRHALSAKAVRAISEEKASGVPAISDAVLHTAAVHDFLGLPLRSLTIVYLLFLRVKFAIGAFNF